jgi:hypothetical protein
LIQSQLELKKKVYLKRFSTSLLQYVLWPSFKAIKFQGIFICWKVYTGRHSTVFSNRKSWIFLSHADYKCKIVLYELMKYFLHRQMIIYLTFKVNKFREFLHVPTVVLRSRLLQRSLCQKHFKILVRGIFSLILIYKSPGSNLRLKVPSFLNDMGKWYIKRYVKQSVTKLWSYINELQYVIPIYVHAKSFNRFLVILTVDNVIIMANTFSYQRITCTCSM